MGHVYYCGSDADYHYLATDYFLKPTRRYRIETAEYSLPHTRPRTRDRDRWLRWPEMPGRDA